MPSEHIENFLKQLLGKQDVPAFLQFTSVGGGSINTAYQVSVNDKTKVFLKLNKADRYPHLFQKEKEGLMFLSAQHCIKIPSVLFCGTYEDEQILLLEWVHTGSRTDSFWKKFGEQLALLHHCSQQQFGFTTDNYMGALAQANNWTDNWTDFFIHQRLLPQIQLASQQNLLPAPYVDLFQQLYKGLGTIFPKEPPSLLHGDLWSGNFMCNEQSQPVLIDPAVYYGHRSMDLAMTTLFGGFDKEFYDAYHYHFPLPSNYEEQWEICNLYPLLIHLNLFGQSYLGDIAGTLKKYS
jgi:protein-ribulosamine 3-kinase